MSRTLNEYLKSAGLRADNPANQQPKQAAAQQPQPKQAAQGKAAEGSSAPARQESRGEAAGGHKPRQDHTDAEAQDTGATGGETAAQAAPNKEASVPQVNAGQVVYDPDLVKTAAQQWCLENGMLVPDANKAQAIYDSHVKTAQAQKQAEEQKIAAELEARGAVMYHGMVKESAAFQIATGEMDMAGAMKTAAYLGCQLNDLVGRAREIKTAMTDVEVAATPNDVFFAGQKGMAARSGSSQVLQGAARNGNTTEFDPEATQGTRQPAHGPDENTQRMVDTVTMPGNPGVNHGQKVDQGKGLGQ